MIEQVFNPLFNKPCNRTASILAEFYGQNFTGTQKSPVIAFYWREISLSGGFYPFY